MDVVVIEPQGRLTLEGGEDVTLYAHEFLFHPVTLAQGVTLGSVLELVRTCPMLRSIFRRSDVDNLLVEALGPTPPYELKGGLQVSDIEYATLYRCAYQDSSTPGSKQLSGFNYLNLHGVGHVAADARYSAGTLVTAKGERPVFSFEATSARKLIHLPLKLDTVMTVSEEDKLEPEFVNKVDTFQCADVNLGEMLDAVLSELTWTGP